MGRKAAGLSLVQQRDTVAGLPGGLQHLRGARFRSANTNLGGTAVRNLVLPRPRSPRCGHVLTFVSLFLTLASILLLLSSSGYSAQVTIAWDANSEPEVAGYKLHYGTSAGQYPSLSDAGGQTTCTLAGLQAGVAYFFAATAYDTRGNQSNYSQEVTFTVPSVTQDKSATYDLVPGWTLISLPFQLSNPEITSALAPIAGKYSIVWAYRNGTWQYYTPQLSGENTLQSMDAGAAYWIKMTAPGQLQVPGATASKTGNLTNGWNFVGYSAGSAQSVGPVLSSIAGKYDIVWTYENGQWRYYDPADAEGGTLSQFRPGNGYWIKMREATIWTLP